MSSRNSLRSWKSTGAGACTRAAIDLWRRTRWGHRLAVGLLTANLVGDALNSLLRHDVRTLMGLPIAGALIAYLLSPSLDGTAMGAERSGARPREVEL
jgi:fluoride ion exporter CrcB/FEX